MGLFSEGPLSPGVRAYLDRVKGWPGRRRNPVHQPPQPPRRAEKVERLRTRPYLAWVNPRPPRGHAACSCR